MLKWFKNLIASIDKFNSHQRDVDTLIEMATKLDYLKFKGIQSSDKSILRIFVPYFTIVEYLGHLNEWCDALSNDHIIHLESFHTQIRNIPIASFFLNMDGCYIDEIKTLAAFNDAVSSLALAYRNKLDSDTQTGLDNHNLRHLTPVINNLYELYQTFNEIS